MDNNGYNNYGNQGGYQGGMPNGNYGYNGGVPQQNAGSGFAITSLVCGILSILCCYCTLGVTVIPAIMAIIFGIVAQKKGQSKGLSIAGIITGVIGLLLSLGMILYIVFVGGVAFLESFSQYM